MRIPGYVCLCLALFPVFGAPRRSTPKPAKQQTIPGVDVCERAIPALNGTIRDPLDYPATLQGFQSFLSDSGVEQISAAEMTRPNHPDIAARLGYSHFLPERSWWPRGAALALLAGKLRAASGESVTLRNWWRPADYNAHPLVGGAPKGDHPTGHAIDLDYSTVRGRIRAESALRKLAKAFPWMQLSLGFGEKTTHVGIGSPRGAREWHYAGWRPGTRG